MIRLKWARETSPVGSILNRSVDRRFEHASALRVLVALIVIVFSAGVDQASAESGWKMTARSSTIIGDPGQWVRAQKPGSSDPLLAHLQLQSVACADVHTCFVMGSQLTPNGTNGGLVISASHDGGSSWSTVYRQPGAGSGLLSCPGPRQCYAIGWSFGAPPQSPRMALLHTTDGGKSWRRSSLDLGNAVGFFLTAFTCPAATVCYLAAMTSSLIQTNGAPQSQAWLVATKNGGQNWTRTRIAGVKNLTLRAIACTGVTSCDVGGDVREKSCFQSGAVLHTGDGGSTWVRQFGACASGITALACPTSRACYAGGWYGSFGSADNQLVLRTKDGGATWQDTLAGPFLSAVTPTDPNPGIISSIACPDVRACFLSAGNHIVATTDGGETWTIQTTVGNAVLTSVTCPTTRVCVSVGTVQPSYIWSWSNATDRSCFAHHRRRKNVDEIVRQKRCGES
jgi:photosystem II stability/assembly factor-like uncharacterized protein